MALAPFITEFQRRKVLRLARDGWLAEDIARHPTLWRDRVRPPHRRTINRILDGQRATPDTPSAHTGSRPASNTEAAEEWLEENPPPKTKVGDLAPSVLATLRDFEAFCRRYEGQRLYDCQQRWLTHALAHPYAMVLAPPRHGKTQLFSVMLVVWLLCGGGHPDEYYDNPENPLRDGQVLLVSKSEPQAKKNWLAVSNRLQLNSKLIKDFGRFKDTEAIWQASTCSMTVAGRQREILSGDYSLTVVGAGSGVLGRGANTIVCDDPADLKNCKRPEQAEELMLWLRTEIFSRLEPEGRFVVIGARLPLANDPYSQIEHMVWLDHDTEPEEDTEGELPRLFSTLVEPAVLDWGTKTLLCPERWAWRGLMARRSFLGQQVFEAVYQQNPAAAGFVRFHEDWIYGRNGFAGCLDHGRRIGETKPLRLNGEPVPSVRVASLDPSPEKYCGALLMDVPQRGGIYAPCLIDIRRAKLPTPAMMDLLREWHREYRFRVLVIEKNSASFFIQTEEFQDWRRESGVRVFEQKTTGANRPHVEYGFDTLAPDVENGRVRIPWGDLDSRYAFGALLNEMLGRLPTNDLLMALWFPKWWLPAIRALEATDAFDRYVPAGFVDPPPRMAVSAS